MAKYILTTITLGLLGTYTMASETTGLCEAEAVERALATAPGRDESAPASLSDVKLIRSKILSSSLKIETYFVRTEDQGGTAASLISVKVKDESSLEDEVLRISCKAVGQHWVE